MRRAWFNDVGPWWGPYVGVILLAAVAMIVVAAVILLNAPELIRIVLARRG